MVWPSRSCGSSTTLGTDDKRFSRPLRAWKTHGWATQELMVANETHGGRDPLFRGGIRIRRPLRRSERDDFHRHLGSPSGGSGKTGGSFFFGAHRVSISTQCPSFEPRVRTPPPRLRLRLETIAVGRGIRELKLRGERWQGALAEQKVIARIRFSDGSIYAAEVHRYEAHGIGRKDEKIRRLLGR